MALVAALLITIIALAQIYYLIAPMPAQQSFLCAPNSVSAKPSSPGLLANFPTSCINITSADRKSTILNGMVYVAGTASQQAQGFMNVTNFGTCNGSANGNARCVGMIFNFTSSQDLCFWMHDTKIPLQQDWIAGNGTIVYEYQAQPESDASVCFFAKYVLETFPNASIPIGSIATFTG